MASGDSTPAQPQKQPFFETDICRIPALLFERDSKTLLAFAEQRKTSADESAEKLVMKRGEVKEKPNSSEKTVTWEELQVVDKAHTEKYRPMNPCPVYDKVNKKLFLFFIRVEKGVTEDWQKKNYLNRTRLCYIPSTDLGKHWGDVIDLTDTLTEIQTWATFAVGPGHGIQTKTKDDKYILTVPVHACCRYCKNACHFLCCHRSIEPKQYALSLYSDDAGKNWKFGEMFETKSGECQMAEISENQIYCNARSENGFRVETFSDDNGVKFSQNKSAKKLKESNNGCQGSVISFPAENASNQNSGKWLLFTHPTTPERKNLGVYLNKSPRDPNAWSRPWVINDGPSGYSDLAYIDGSFACLYECGDYEIHGYIAFEVFSYNDIMKKCKQV